MQRNELRRTITGRNYKCFCMQFEGGMVKEENEGAAGDRPHCKSQRDLGFFLRVSRVVMM